VANEEGILRPKGGITRRDFVRRVGMGAAALTLADAGMLAQRPGVAEAAGLLPPGYLSTSGSQIIGASGQPVGLKGVIVRLMWSAGSTTRPLTLSAAG
jgi:hypothetical protein